VASSFSHAVLVPVKAFHSAKERLSAVLSDTERAQLARRLASTVLEAARPLDIMVVCDDPEVARFAKERGAAVSFQPGRGLNTAVQAAAWELVSSGKIRVSVVHADLADPSPLAEMLGSVDQETILLVPDRRLDGTNVASLPSVVLRQPDDGSGFRFGYGPGSLGHHIAEADRLGRPARVVKESNLCFDIDEPGDLDLARSLVGNDSLLDWLWRNRL